MTVTVKPFKRRTLGTFDGKNSLTGARVRRWPTLQQQQQQQHQQESEHSQANHSMLESSDKMNCAELSCTASLLVRCASSIPGNVVNIGRELHRRCVNRRSLSNGHRMATASAASIPAASMPTMPRQLHDERLGKPSGEMRWLEVQDVRCHRKPQDPANRQRLDGLRHSPHVKSVGDGRNSKDPVDPVTSVKDHMQQTRDCQSRPRMAEELEEEKVQKVDATGICRNAGTVGGATRCSVSGLVTECTKLLLSILLITGTCFVLALLRFSMMLLCFSISISL